MKNSELKIIDKDTPIIIYGAAGNGMRGYYSLKSLNGFNVIGFIDKRNDEIKSQYGLPVWSLEESARVNEVKEIVVCVCIRNVFEHVTVVNALIEKGFKYIIFKPLAFIDNEMKAINDNYDKIFAEREKLTHFDLKPILPVNKLEYYDFKDYGIITEDNNDIVVNMSLEHIFVDAVDWNICMKNQCGFLPVISLFPQINLAKSLFGHNGNLDVYLNYCSSTINTSINRYGAGGGKIEDTPSWRKSIIENRKIVFDKMNESLELEYDFFIRNAPFVSLLDSGYLLLSSAKHRAAFFIAKERKYMPVKISKEDYNIFLKMKVVKDLKELFIKKNVDKINIPILHPFFYKFSSNVANYYECFFRNIVNYLAENLVNKNIYLLKFCDAIDDDGMSARLFSKFGCQSVFVYDKNNINFEYWQLLDKLYETNSIDYQEKFIDSDILFIREEDLNKLRINPQFTFILSKNSVLDKKMKFKMKKLGEIYWKDHMEYYYVCVNRKI